MRNTHTEHGKWLLVVMCILFGFISFIQSQQTHVSWLLTCLTAIVQLGKLRPTEFKRYAKGYIANYVAELGSSPDVSDFKFWAPSSVTVPLTPTPHPPTTHHPFHVSPLLTPVSPSLQPHLAAFTPFFLLPGSELCS